MCFLCGKDSNYRVVEGKVLCRFCYSTDVCLFCDPRVFRDHCPGHSLSLIKGNRFMEDKDFVMGMNFDIEGHQVKQQIQENKHDPRRR